jgi:hypothetical protein
VAVIIPNAKISARWSGALEVRLRHAPLEAFLRSRGLKWAVSGEARITGNLACATIYLVGKALDALPGGRVESLQFTRHSAVGQMACAASSSLALLIQEPAYWRTAALVATARLLEKGIGLSAAARLAAAAARDYHTMVGNGSLEAVVLKIGHAVRRAVDGNDAGLEEAAVELICARLASVPPESLEARSIRTGGMAVYALDGTT